MSHPGHEIVRCSECDKVIMQCRCIHTDKPTRYMVCDDCRKNPQQLDQVGRAAEVAAAALIDLAKEIQKAYVKPKTPVSGAVGES